jgi:Protein phosphatase 2C
VRNFTSCVVLGNLSSVDAVAAIFISSNNFNVIKLFGFSFCIQSINKLSFHSGSCSLLIVQRISHLLINVLHYSILNASVAYCGRFHHVIICQSCCLQGDHIYKRNTAIEPREQMITSLPDVRSMTLDDEDQFMVLACDGIW